MGSIPLGVYEKFQSQSLEHYDSMKEWHLTCNSQFNILNLNNWIMKNIQNDNFFLLSNGHCILRSSCQKIFNIGLLCMSYINMNIFNQYDNKLDFLKLIDHWMIDFQSFKGFFLHLFHFFLNRWIYLCKWEKSLKVDLLSTSSYSKTNVITLHICPICLCCF